MESVHLCEDTGSIGEAYQSTDRADRNLEAQPRFRDWLLEVY